jgi:hypothetical protein
MSNCGKRSEEQAKKYPNDTLINTVFLPQTHAADDLVHQALRDLESMEAYNLISQQEYLRGLAYLDLKDGVNAARGFPEGNKKSRRSRSP